MEPRSDPDGTPEFELIGMRHSSCEKETYSVIFCISPTSFFNCFKMVDPQLYINVFIIIVHMSGVNTNMSSDSNGKREGESSPRCPLAVHALVV